MLVLITTAHARSFSALAAASLAPFLLDALHLTRVWSLASQLRPAFPP